MKYSDQQSVMMYPLELQADVAVDPQVIIFQTSWRIAKVPKD